MTNSLRKLLLRYSIVILAAPGFLLGLTPAYADIVFSAQVLGPVSNLYAVNDKGELLKLTDNIRWRDMDALTMRSRQIAFTSNREENTKIELKRKSEDFNIFTIDTSGKNLQQLTTEPSRDVSPKFSPDGRLLAYRKYSGNQCQLVIIEPGTKKQNVLATADDIVDFSWSPDSKQIAYAKLLNKQSALIIAPIKKGEATTLVTTTTGETNKDIPTTHAFSQVTANAWSPDGKHIAYILHPLKASARQLRVVNIDTANDSLVSPANAQVQDSIDWSVDSKSILYSALINYKFWYDEKTYQKVYEGGMHIFVSSIDGKSLQLTKGDHLFGHPVYSPDNKRIAFFYADALDARKFSLKVMGIDGTNITELYNSVASHSSLVWY